MAKGDPKKPKGKMSAYAFFVQTCREEHKKKNPEVPVNFAEFSKKCSERWKVCFFYIFPATLSWISHFLVTDLQCSSRWLFSSSLLRLILSLLRILFYFWRFCKGLRLSSPFASDSHCCHHNYRTAEQVCAHCIEVLCFADHVREREVEVRWNGKGG